jgi:cytochrome c nitrite reductase small subunit
MRFLKQGPLVPTAFFILIGALAGLCVYTFGYAGGHAYLSSDPKACVQCHVMQEHFDSWQKSSHHAVAKCVDCHLSHNPVKKWLDKGENGALHSMHFTLNTHPDPVKLRSWHKGTVLGNCLQCHQGLVDDVHRDPKGKAMDCLHCHQGVAHGAAR